MSNKPFAVPQELHELSKEKALDLLRQMWEIRLFEDRVYDLLGRNII
jgi:TPP-dependent pyruvate/acetoin dehydrogenase alpha subunit